MPLFGFTPVCCTVLAMLMVALLVIVFGLGKAADEQRLEDPPPAEDPYDPMDV